MHKLMNYNEETQVTNQQTELLHFFLEALETHFFAFSTFLRLPTYPGSRPRSLSFKTNNIVILTSAFMVTSISLLSTYIL